MRDTYGNKLAFFNTGEIIGCKSSSQLKKAVKTVFRVNSEICNKRVKVSYTRPFPEKEQI